MVPIYICCLWTTISNSQLPFTLGSVHVWTINHNVSYPGVRYGGDYKKRGASIPLPPPHGAEPQDHPVLSSEQSQVRVPGKVYGKESIQGKDEGSTAPLNPVPSELLRDACDSAVQEEARPR